MENEGRVLTNNENMVYFKESRIFKIYRFKETNNRYTLNIEFVKGYIGANTNGKFRAYFLQYLRNVNKRINKDVSSKKWVGEERMAVLATQS